jgi:MFS family permease
MPAIAERPAAPVRPPRPRIYYGWLMLLVAAWAMTCTLPGRTHGLGLITGPLTADAALGVNEPLFAVLNFWAILLGSLLCLPTGRWLDRFGARAVLTAVAVGLAAAVIAMSRVTSATTLFLALTLVRGLGQGALSVVSMALVGKWFTRRLGVAMGLYTVLLSIGFIATTLGLGQAVTDLGWRPAWQWVGLALLVTLAVPAWLLTRDTPESLGMSDGKAAADADQHGVPLRAALRTPMFWAFGLGAALFNLAWSAITLFNESILAERGFDRNTFVQVMGVLVFIGLPANLLTGWAAQKYPPGRLLAAGMALLALSLVSFPLVKTLPQVMLYAAALGASGGIVTVLFFTSFAQAFGRAHLGAIQAAVQVLTVVASALGPVLLTQTKSLGGSYSPFFFVAAPLALVVGLACWWAPWPASAETP